MTWATRLRRLICRMRGHDYALQLGSQQMVLVCVTCASQSAGWDLRGPGPRRKALPVSGNTPAADARVIVIPAGVRVTITIEPPPITDAERYVEETQRLDRIARIQPRR